MSVSRGFRLKVQRIEQICLFELSWGKGQQLSCTLNYPPLLTNLYQEWQRIYLSFYKQALRGRLEEIGGIAPPPIDWHARLVQAEAKLLYEFHHWLRSAELFEIRACMAKSQRSPVSGKEIEQQAVNVFLTCEPLELARLPWEAWEIGAEFTSHSGGIRIVRTPGNIRHDSGEDKSPNSRNGKARILVILGDDTGLDFQAERVALLSCKKVAEIELVGWQPGVSIPELKVKICEALADDRGWDVLFFAGHSNETELTGGELAIAPGISLSINEIAPQLRVAKTKGLKFALFNSCSGLNIAESLIDLGLSQVVVMREPIHNDVAQSFLMRFLQVLAEHKDVQEAILAACQHLKLDKNLTYPSASLIPSLFAHAEAQLFRIPQKRWKERVKKLLPTRNEAIAVSILALLSLSLPVQDFLLEKRILVQAIYRHLTGQIPPAAPPSVLLVQIDEKSIQKAKIADPKPMDRLYLAQLIDKLSALESKVIGIDFLLDRPQGEKDKLFSQSLQAAVQKPNSTWFVFASVRDDTAGWLTALPEIANPHWSLQGSINLSHWYVSTVWNEESADFELPFAYLLALAYRLAEPNPPAPFPPLPNPPLLGEGSGINLFSEGGERQNFPPPRFGEGGRGERFFPQLNSQTTLFSQATNYLTEKGKNYKNIFSERAIFHPITSLSYDFGQMWLQPIIDFSIPPDRVYQSIPAWQLLESVSDATQLRNIQQQIVMIAPFYSEAGVRREGEDNYPLPDAIRYWLKLTRQNERRSFAGGEAHAYAIAHFLKTWLVIPIPDVWAIAFGVLLGKLISLFVQKPLKGRGWAIWIAATAVYGLASLQIYLWAAVLLPCFLPSVVVWMYANPVILRKKKNASI